MIPLHQLYLIFACIFLAVSMKNKSMLEFLGYSCLFLSFATWLFA